MGVAHPGATVVAGGQRRMPEATLFSQHLGERLHLTTFARPSKYVANLALSVQRAGGVLNVLGARDDVSPVPPEFKIDDTFRRDLDFKFAYGQRDGKEEKELGYRRILFKRLLFLWRLAGQLPPTDLLLYVDGDDVLFQRPLNDVVAAWRGLVGEAAFGEEPVVFMGYPSCSGRFDGDHRRALYPIAESSRGLRGAEACARWRFVQPNGTLPFLDSGGYLGRASMVRLVLEDALELARQGVDYICMSALTVTGIRLGPRRLRVDSEAKLFYSVRPMGYDTWKNWTPEVARPFCGPSYFDAAGLPPAFAPTGATPAVLHFVGPSKWYWLNACVEAFKQRRRLELEGLVGGLPVAEGTRAAALADSGTKVAADGFAKSSGQFCHFTACAPSAEGNEDCIGMACENTEGIFMYFDVDRGVAQQMPFAALLGNMAAATPVAA